MIFPQIILHSAVHIYDFHICLFLPELGFLCSFRGKNCLKSWVRLWLFEEKSGANEQLIKIRGDYLLICKGDIKKRILHGRAGIRILSSSAERDTLEHEKIKFVSPSSLPRRRFRGAPLKTPAWEANPQAAMSVFCLLHRYWWNS